MIFHVCVIKKQSLVCAVNYVLRHLREPISFAIELIYTSRFSTNCRHTHKIKFKYNARRFNRWEYIILCILICVFCICISTARDMFIVLNLSFVVKFPPFSFARKATEKNKTNRKIAYIRDDSLVLSRLNHEIVPEAWNEDVTQTHIMMVYLRFAQLRGSGNANRLCANAIVAPIVSSVNVRSTDILHRKRIVTRKKYRKITYFFQKMFDFAQTWEKQKITSVLFVLELPLDRNEFNSVYASSSLAFKTPIPHTIASTMIFAIVRTLAMTTATSFISLVNYTSAPISATSNCVWIRT